MAGTDYKLELLRKVPFFRGLNKKDLGLVERLADEIDVKAGKILIKQGTSGHEFFIVIEGALGVERDGWSASGRSAPVTSPGRSP